MAKSHHKENFKPLKDALLGKKYELSVAFVGAREARRLNRIYRGKDYPANVLAFPYSKNSGEIIVCPPRPGSGRDGFSVQRLVIHAMLHLAGYKHGVIMETKERYYDKKYFSRNRCRHARHARGGRRAR